MVKTSWSYDHWFWVNSSARQTDRRTDTRSVAKSRSTVKQNKHLFLGSASYALYNKDCISDNITLQT